MRNKALITIGVLLVLFTMTSCKSNPEKGLLERYFHAVALNDVTTLSSMALEPVTIDAAKWSITKVSEEKIEPATLPDLNAKELDFKKKMEQHVGPVMDAKDALDAAKEHRPFSLEPERVEELETAFSRGFSTGWLDGPHPHSLVPGKNTAKRGVPIGLVEAVRGDRIVVRLTRSVRRGQGVVFEELHDQDAEQGGRIYEIFLKHQSVEQADAESEVELAFGRDDLDLRRIQPGQSIFRTDDPRLMKELRKSFETS